MTRRDLPRHAACVGSAEREHGTQAHMAELVRQQFPGDHNAAVFADRIEAVESLPP